MMGDIEDFADEFEMGIGRRQVLDWCPPACSARSVKTNKQCRNYGHYKVDGEFYCAKHLPIRGPSE